MKKCQNCNIRVGSSGSVCPLCQGKLSGEGDEANWPALSLKTQAFFYKFQLLIVFAAIAICLLTDFRLKINGGKHFSLFVLMWGLVLEFLIYDSLKRNVVVAKIITYSMIFVSFLLGLTGWYFGFITPIISVVIPSLISATLVSNFIFTLIDKSGNAMVFLLGNIAFGIIPYVILSIMDYEKMLVWTICLMIIVVALLAIMIFRGRKVINELQKRMNF